MTTAARASLTGLLRGTGDPEGEYALRYPRDERSMLRVLRDRAQSRGDHTWLVCDGRDSLTFAQAWTLVRRIGAAVRRDAGVGAHVALLMRNQIEFMPCFYGAQVNRGVAVPLNAESRGKHLEYLLDKGDAIVLVVRDELFPRLHDVESLGRVKVVVVTGTAPTESTVHGVPVVSFDSWLDGCTADDTADGTAELPAWTDSAVIQFTSGTTGRAKGVLFSHHYLYMAAAVVADSLRRRADDVLFTPLPVFHVGALHFIANSSLHAGCTAHLVSAFSPSKCWQQVADSGANFAMILGPMVALVHKVTETVPPHKVKQVFCVPRPPACDDFERRFGVEVLWQAYGMTEVHLLPARLELLPDKPMGTLGKPVQWCDFGIVDENDNLLPPGEVGELVFRSLLPYGMISEYYKDPQATVDAFRNFMFHTGDLATYDADGVVYFKGRKQDRIRRRGEMVGAMEIELLVLQHPQILEAAVYAVPSEIGEDDIKLDFVSRETVDPVELRAWCEKQLPKYMVPRYFEQRESFPKTPSERIEKYRFSRDALDRPEVHDAERNKR
jgi:crotonobetaine/carnitine-CoA ligase